MTSSGPQKVKVYYDEAFKYINEALSQDEKKNIREAIHLYHKGLRCLITGLSVKCDGPSCTGSNWGTAITLQEKMKKAKIQIQERLNDLVPPAPVPDILTSDPPVPHPSTLDRNPPSNLQEPQSSIVALPNGVSRSNSQEFWEDVSELILLEDAVNLFFVSETGHVTTLNVPQTLRVFQFTKEHDDWVDMPPAFLQCGRWMFPLIPAKSPVLNTEPRSYMFPDIQPRPNQKFGPNGFSCVGVVMGPSVNDEQVKRFERILKCYSDFRGYSPTPEPGQTRPSSSAIVPRPDFQPPAVTIRQHDDGGMEVVSGSHEDLERKHWSTKVSEGIQVGAEAIAWGVTKGAEIGSHLVHKGAHKLKDNIKPNQQQTRVDPEVESNIRMVKSATGAAVQVSTTIVSVVGTMASQLAKQLAPILVDQGTKYLPKSVKSEEKKDTMEGVVKVAASGARGFGIVYDGLERGWKLLYKSIQIATVDTVDYKYGEAVGRATDDAMGAFGNCLQTYWNIDQLGVKAIAKTTAKQTTKEIVFEGEKRQLKQE